MANYISNVLKVKGLSNLPIFSQSKPQIVDFETIIPSPKTIEECPKEYILGEGFKGKNGLQIHPEDKRPWFNWYDWKKDNWGCKWNVMDGNRIDENTVRFYTANCPPFPVMAKISELAGDEKVTIESFDVDDIGTLIKTEWINGINTAAFIAEYDEEKEDFGEFVSVDTIPEYSENKEPELD